MRPIDGWLLAPLIAAALISSSDERPVVADRVLHLEEVGEISDLIELNGHLLVETTTRSASLMHRFVSPGRLEQIGYLLSGVDLVHWRGLGWYPGTCGGGRGLCRTLYFLRTTDTGAGCSWDGHEQLWSTDGTVAGTRRIPGESLGADSYRRFYGPRPANTDAWRSWNYIPWQTRPYDDRTADALALVDARGGTARSVLRIQRHLEEPGPVLELDGVVYATLNGTALGPWAGASVYRVRTATD